MSLRRIKQPDEKTEINISPMIDMVFILLIFFIVTTNFVDESGIGVDKPVPKPPDRDQPLDKKEDPVMFRLTASGQVMLKGTQVSLARVEQEVKSNLSRKDVPVILQVERSALAGIMIQVMDHAKRGGANQISVTAVDPIK